MTTNKEEAMQSKNSFQRVRHLGLVALLAVGAIATATLTSSPPAQAAAPTALVNIYVADAYGTVRPCYRTTSGSSSKYFCRVISREYISYLPTAAKGKREVAPGNWSVTLSTGLLLEGCTNPSTGFTCYSHASSISIKQYNSNPWSYYASALKSTFVNTGTAATCLYGLYHFDPDITSCL